MERASFVGSSYGLIHRISGHFNRLMRAEAMTEPSAGSLRPTSLDDRRRRPKRGCGGEYRVTVLDGLLSGQHFECIQREINTETASLLVKAELRVGQRVRLQCFEEGHAVGPASEAEVVRSRPLTTGRWEVMIEYRRPTEAPKPSESQRRHERRAQRLARLAGLPVNKSV